MSKGMRQNSEQSMRCVFSVFLMRVGILRQWLCLRAYQNKRREKRRQRESKAVEPPRINPWPNTRPVNPPISLGFIISGLQDCGVFGLQAFGTALRWCVLWGLMQIQCVMGVCKCKHIAWICTWFGHLPRGFGTGRKGPKTSKYSSKQAF